MNPPRSQTPMSVGTTNDSISETNYSGNSSKSVQISSSLSAVETGIKEERGRTINVLSNEERSCFSKIANGSNRFLSKKFRAFGFRIGSYPFRVIGLSVFLALICASGVHKLTNESRSEKLWVPGDTRAQDDRIFVDDNYGGDARFGSVVLKPKTGTNAFTPETLDALHAFRSKIEEEAFVEYDGKNITWGGDYWIVDENSDTEDAAGMKYSKTDKEEWQCYRYSKSCAMSSVLGVFDNNKDNWNTREKIDDILISDVLKDVENCPTGDGKKHHAGNITGNITGNECNPPERGGPDIYLNQTSGHPTLTSEGHYTATSLTLQFLMKNFDVVKDGEKEDKRGDAFEEKVLEIIRDVEVNYASTVSVEYAVTRSFGDEFGAAITGDITKLQIAFILILGYATLMLSKCGEGCVGSRVFVSGMGVVSIGLAIASSYGLCSYFGLFYSPLMNVLPFLLLGIGVDDMFVLVNAYDNTNPYLSIAERLGNALSTAGMSITVTSFTDIFAFLIGSTTSLPALRNFCFYAALGIFFDYLYQLTFFAAFLAIDERRRMLKKGDCFCCPTCDEGATCCVPCCKPAAGAPVVVVVNGVQQEQVGPERMTKRVMGALADFLAKKTVKAAVLVVFSGIAAGGIVGVSKIKVEADVMDFLPPGYLKDWVSTFDDEFSRGQGVELYTMTEFNYAIDYDTTSVLKQAAAAFKANPYVQDESVVTWMDGFDGYLTMCEGTIVMSKDWKSKNCVDPDAPANTFYDKLYKFITTPSSPGGYAYGSDVKFDTTTNPPTIIATRVRATQVEGQDTAATIKAMDSIRSSIDSIPGNEKGYIFAYNEDFLNVEQYKSIDKEAIRNVSLTLLVCFIVIALLIVDPLTVSCVFINLLLIVINILGYMQAWGLNIDSVTVIMLVIALGLAVDYSAHIGRNFLEKHGLPNDRMRLTLRDMGVAVFHGAMSTMVAVLVLGSSDSYVFTTFFKQLFLCISLGLAHGLILLPVCLSLCNPNPYDDLEDDY